MYFVLSAEKLYLWMLKNSGLDTEDVMVGFITSSVLLSQLRFNFFKKSKILSVSFSFTYIFVVECEAKIHSKRTRPLSCLPPDAEKILSFLYPHLLLFEMLGLKVYFL